MTEREKRIFRRIGPLEAEKNRLHDLLEKEKSGSAKWFDIRWDIDEIIEKMCALEQRL